MKAKVLVALSCRIVPAAVSKLSRYLLFLIFVTGLFSCQDTQVIELPEASATPRIVADVSAPATATFPIATATIVPSPVALSTSIVEESPTVNATRSSTLANTVPSVTASATVGVAATEMSISTISPVGLPLCQTDIYKPYLRRGPNAEPFYDLVLQNGDAVFLDDGEVVEILLQTPAWYIPTWYQVRRDSGQAGWVEAIRCERLDNLAVSVLEELPPTNTPEP